MQNNKSVSIRKPFVLMKHGCFGKQYNGNLMRPCRFNLASVFLSYLQAHSHEKHSKQFIAIKIFYSFVW